MKYAVFEKRPPPLSLERGDVVFVGEGLDDCFLIEALTDHWERKPALLTPSDDAGSLAVQFRRLVEFAAKSRVASIGLLFDAENDRSGTQRKLLKMFQAAHVLFPYKASTARVSVVNGVPIKLAYHVNPSGAKRGAIEALFRNQASEGTTGACIQALLECYQKHKKMSVARRDKVLVRTFLSYQSPSNTGLRTALQRGHLSYDGPEFDPLKRFVELLKPKPTPLLNAVEPLESSS